MSNDKEARLICSGIDYKVGIQNYSDMVKSQLFAGCRMDDTLKWLSLVPVSLLTSAAALKEWNNYVSNRDILV